MERIRQKDRKEKLNQRDIDLDEIEVRGSVSKNLEKRKKSGKNATKRPVVKWKFLHDAKIPRIMTMDAYLKTLPTASKTNWDFSSDDSQLERNLDQDGVRITDTMTLLKHF